MIVDAILKAGIGPTPGAERAGLAYALHQAVVHPAMDPDQWRVFLDSALVEEILKTGRREVLGTQLRHLESFSTYSEAEYGRLFTKGQTLYEHCMVEESHACVIGFFDHELAKSRRAEQVVLDLLGWMKRFLDLHQSEPEDKSVRRRIQHTEVMLDHGVAYLYGLNRAQATRLSEHKEPLD